MTAPAPQVPDRIQRLIDERAVESVAPDGSAIVNLWSKAVNSHLDAREPALSMDNRVGLAYQAGLQAVFAYLAVRGYRVRSTKSHHYYTFYAAQALAQSEGRDALRHAAEEMDGHRARRATAVYDPEPASAQDLTDILGILDRLLPAIRDALLSGLPEMGAKVGPIGKRP